jgi:glycosyltransferase involved in cell wall biosynthesis
MSQVDVVIPAFNAAQYLSEAIQSVLAQGPQLGRIIVVDDGSTDGTAELVHNFAGPIELVSEPHRGAGAARNAGVRRCSAEFLAFLDADDRWLPGKLAIQVAALNADRTFDFAICKIRCFASPELPTDERAGLEHRHAQPLEGWNASALLIRRIAFERVGSVHEDLRVGEMIDWFNRARLLGLRAAIVDETLIERRLHRRNTTREQIGSYRDYALAAKRHLDRLRAVQAGKAAANGEP